MLKEHLEDFKDNAMFHCSTELYNTNDSTVILVLKTVFLVRHCLFQSITDHFYLKLLILILTLMTFV